MVTVQCNSTVKDNNAYHDELCGGWQYLGSILEVQDLWPASDRKTRSQIIFLQNLQVTKRMQSTIKYEKVGHVTCVLYSKSYDYFYIAKYDSIHWLSESVDLVHKTHG